MGVPDKFGGGVIGRFCVSVDCEQKTDGRIEMLSGRESRLVSREDPENQQWTLDGGVE
jgi:hypothetical protein